MNIFHVNLQKGWRGGEQQLAYLITELKARNYEQVLICLKNSALENFAIKENINYLSVDSFFLKKLFSLKKINKLIQQKNIEIIHCHESKAHSLILFLKIFFSFNSKIILHRRVVFPIRGFFSKKIKYSNKFITKVICISKAVETVFQESTGYKNTVIVSSMTNTKFNYKNENILNAKYNIQNKIIIGYIAALTYEKDHYTFLETAKKLTQHKNLHFIIVGDGADKNKIINYSKKLELDNVSFLGFIENAKKLIPEIDILLFTSLKEGLGSTILDFFVAKKPVISVKNGGSEELIINLETGFLCNPKDSDCLAKNIQYILENPNIKNNITQSAFTFVENNFSILSITNKTIKVYESVLKNTTN